MSRLEHPFSQEDLMAFADGQLEAGEASKVKTHIDGCADCAAGLADFVRLSQQMAWQVEPSPKRVAEGVLAELKQDRNAGVVVTPQRSWWLSPRVLLYGFGGALVALSLLVLVAAPSLLRSRQAANEASPVMTALPPPAGQTAPRASVVESQSQQGSAGPMMIRTIRLTVITKEFDNSRAAVDALAKRFQGYIDKLALKADAGAARSLSATLRFPANQADAALNELKKLGRLIDESQNSADVTSQYVDLTARLSNARNTEQRLLGLLRDRAGNLKDVVEMEHEIASVREGIERMQAQEKDLTNRVQFVAIQLELSEEYHAQLEPPAPDPSTPTQLRNAAVEGIRSAAQSILDIALAALRYGPVLLIWFVAIGLVIFVLWRLKVTRLPGF